MTPAAQVQAAIEILDRWRNGTQAMDRVLTGWARQNRYAGSGDRRRIGDLVHDALRRLRSAAWTAGGDHDASGRCVMHGLMLLQGTDPGDVFTGDRHAPAALSPDEISIRRDLSGASRAVRFDYPDWLVTDLDSVPDRDLKVLQNRAPVDLRVNLLKTDRDGAIRALESDGIDAVPVELSATALRVVEGRRKVRSSRTYADGLVEIQDAASQAIVEMANVSDGENVLDLCAGAGGKTLALAAAMQGRGQLIAHDIDAGRMVDLPKRAKRAGAKIRIAASGDLPANCELVVVDAPCSGSGTWRRNPDSKWRLDKDELLRLCKVQSEILNQAATLVGPGGRLLYATCSMLDCENEQQVTRFLETHSDWQSVHTRHLRPTEGGDGFFGAILAPV